MNFDQLRGIWGQLRGRGKVAYGDLTDDPNYVAQGNAEQIVGRVQQGFGNARQSIQRGLRKLRNY
jgi:uncharacterized protein YjbJ (UPF0337 family)